MKRCFDITVATIALIALAPLMGIIACAIWLSDPAGPIIYRGLRVGRGGRIFHMFKFRSMRSGTGIKREITVSGDVRVTPVGRLLRASKLDELPQLINVLRGDMSLVGPRPESPRYIAYYTAEQRAVLAVRPGITGLSQIFFRREEQLLSGPNSEHYYITVVMPAKLAIDLAYIRNWSFWRDLVIIAGTLMALVRPPAQPPLPPAGEPAPVAALIGMRINQEQAQ
jgi:lipopolysaccharide/colanic/teichoic acid biosynthesis glycosyltransferase